jgi:hypothetical protein
MPKLRLRKDISLYFHPFRLLVLHQIARVFTIRTSPVQYLLHPPGYQNVISYQIESLDAWSSSEKAVERFNTWNTMAEVAISFESIYHGRVFGRIRWRVLMTEEESALKTCEYGDRVKMLIEERDVDLLESYRQDLCSAAEIMDDNKILHVLIRLTRWHGRHDVKSKLGGCMLLLAMAEVIRRAMEEALVVRRRRLVPPPWPAMARHRRRHLLAEGYLPSASDH